jgi:hypothetical protein
LMLDCAESPLGTVATIKPQTKSETTGRTRESARRQKNHFLPKGACAAECSR